VGQDTDRTKFVVGLGNPSRQYANTRHNVGFMVVQALRRRWQALDGRRAFSGVMCDVRVHRPEAGVRRVMTLEPQTYMNRSGLAVRQLADFYKAAPEEMLIVLDDMALPVGRLRIRADGSAGGHNGLADILAAMGTQAVPRLRIGIGSPQTPSQWKDFVLSTFSSDEAETIRQAVQTAAQAVEDWVFGGTRYVMDRYNRSADDEPEKL
jgi:PTH1 family peptidyl-tRNA hydrolase